MKPSTTFLLGAVAGIDFLVQCVRRQERLLHSSDADSRQDQAFPIQAPLLDPRQIMASFRMSCALFMQKEPKPDTKKPSNGIYKDNLNQGCPHY